jgi:O-antigen ligase
MKFLNFVMKNFSRNFMLIWVAAGISLTTATQLRLPGIPLGPGEMMIVTWMLVVAIRVFVFKHHLMTITALTKAIFLFWIVSFASLMLGLLNSNARGVVSKQVYHDIFAFSFIFIFSLIFSAVIKSHYDIKKIITFFCSFSLLCLLGIFAFPSFLPFDSWYYDVRFIGWATNANSLALLLVANPFLLLYLLQQEVNLRAKTWYFTLIIITFVIGIATNSDALRMGWVGGGLVMVIVAILGLTAGKNQTKAAFLNKSIAQIFILILIFFPSILFLIFSAPDKVSVVDNVYNEGGQGSERIILWTHGLMALSHSPLFGCGPGAYSGLAGPFGDFEAHNTFIDWSVSSGIIGLATYITLLGWICWHSWRNKSAIMLGAITSLILFSMTHYTIRHPSFWLYLMVIAQISTHPVTTSNYLNKPHKYLRKIML